MQWWEREKNSSRTIGLPVYYKLIGINSINFLVTLTGVGIRTHTLLCNTSEYRCVMVLSPKIRALLIQDQYYKNHIMGID